MPFLSNNSEDRLTQARLQMVERQLKARDMRDLAVLDVMRTIPRHLFVPTDLMGEAYDDNPLPIGYGQTISQPYIVGSMTEQLLPSKEKRVLEIGTGSGYQTAVLAELFKYVYTVEIIQELSERARKVLMTLGYSNISFYVGDGLKIPSEPKEFDSIIVTAAPEQFPPVLVTRLAIGGRLVIPVGGALQNLKLIIKEQADQVVQKELYPVRFVALQSED